MTQPPPGPWNPQQPGPWAPQEAQQWTAAPGYAGDSGGPGPSGSPQQPWPAPAPPPGNGGGKWVIATVALLVVIALVVVGVAIWTSNDSGNGSVGAAASSTDEATASSTTAAPTTAADSAVTPGGDTTVITSANDTAPVAIITEDPTCEPWAHVIGDFQSQQGAGWHDREYNTPAADWTPREKKFYEDTAKAYRHAADRTVGLARLTPHRVMREMYEQFTAFARAYADSIPTYNGVKDEFLTDTAAAFAGVLSGVCDGVNYGDIKAHPPQVPAAVGPSAVAPVDDPAQPKRAMPTINAQCDPWRQAYKDVTADPVYTAWANQGVGVSATQWSDEKKKANQDVIPAYAHFYDTIENIGRQSGDPLMEDMGVLAKLYGQAFNAAIPTYTSSDTLLHDAAWQSTVAIYSACGVAGAH